MSVQRSAVNSMCLVLGAALVAAGCGSGAGQYTPAPQAARGSLEAALAAWRDGDPPGTVQGTPCVQVVDSTRREGQSLRSFEILSETSAGAQGRCYVVVGIDPIWVFRKEDYDHLGHWEHPMPEAPPQPTPLASPAADETPAPAAATSIPTTSHERS